MNIENLKQWISENKSIHDICIITGKSYTAIRYWLKKYKLSTNFVNFSEAKRLGGENFIKINHKRKNPGTRKGNRNELSSKITAYNWVDIQNFYNDGNNWREVMAKFNMTNYILFLGVKAGLFKTVKNRRKSTTIYKHTEESKQKIREARIKYLQEHPNESSWRNVQGKESAPERFVKNFLNEKVIEYKAEFQPLLHIKRFFCIDISFPDIKVGWEINGGQHYDTNGNLKPYYQNRHDLIENHGWKLIEIPYWNAFKTEALEKYLLQTFNTPATNRT